MNANVERHWVETVEEAMEMLADRITRDDFGRWMRRKLEGHERVDLKLMVKHDKQGGYTINLSADQITRRIDMQTLLRLE